MNRLNINPHATISMDVERWHTMPTMGRQTVGHHTARMMMLCWQVVPIPREELLFRILIHDAAEVHTGDIPAPVKWGMPKEVEQWMRDKEWAALQHLGVEDYPRLEEWEEWMVAFLDITEAMTYSMSAMAEGRQFSKVAASNCRDRMKQLLDDYQPEWPEEVKRRATELAKTILPKSFKEL